MSPLLARPVKAPAASGPGSVPPKVAGTTAVAIRLAAIELFAERGYSNTTMQAIAQRVGIQPSGIYNHVDSKQTLLRDITQEAIEELIEIAHAGIASTDDIAQQIYRAAAGHAAYHATHRLEMFICNGEIPNIEEPARTRVVTHRQEYVRVFTRVIERGIAAGRFAPVSSPRLTTYAILQMGIGVSVWYHDDGDLSPTDIGDLYGRYALKLVGAPEGA